MNKKNIVRKLLGTVVVVCMFSGLYLLSTMVPAFPKSAVFLINSAGCIIWLMIVWDS